MFLWQNQGKDGVNVKVKEKKNRLLIVDDEKVNLKILTHMLGAEYTIYTATNGTEALEKAREYKPDVILLDIIMPEMDGYQMLSELKKCRMTQGIPVIFTTGLNTPEDEEKGLSLGAADYIVKPFRSTIVVLRVRNQIQILNHLRAIEQMSMIDPLTNMPNRRCFDERLNMEWKQAIREQPPISLLMTDLDRFKSLNDTYGHQQGDMVLQMVAKALSRSFRRPGDFAARWGGEEFAILLPNTPITGAMDVAEKIRAEVELTHTLNADGSEIKITISIGANSSTPVLGCSIDDFIYKADKALYAAKETGRNKVVHTSL